MKFVKTILTIIVFALMLTGCNKPIKESVVVAEVIAREFVPERVVEDTITITVDDVMMMSPVTTTYPEKYIIEFRYQDLIKSVDNKAVYDSYDIGDDIEVMLYEYESGKRRIQY